MATAAAFLPATPTPRPRLAASFPSSRHLSPIFAGATEAASSSSEDAGDIDEAATRGGGGKDRRRAVRIAWEKLVRWSRSWRRRNRSDVLETTRKVVVLGGGSFGTAMAAHMAAKKADLEVAMLLRDDHICQSINQSHVNCKYLPEHRLPENIVATTSAIDALTGADFCFHAVPVQFSSSFLESISTHVDPKLPFISLSKGLELNTLRTMSKIIPKALGNPRQPFIVLSGPSFAVELMNKLPTGVEIAGALKNVLAIAAGIVEGMHLGNNCMAALVAQGCSEIRWLATKVAEGVSTAGAVIALAQKYNVKMPVLTAVARIIDNELTPKKAVMELMNLPQVEEV
ncbi:hypothetical protein PR202_ga27926 [Eleusine coracana subsp. coracana]|uniref:Glycerol-3-phosphate dehydrogenase [NAD(+)] n=1 Tax=Eleusine coracana subsp. coracana TaxID=191504 RepID=A0AAV5DHZ2_ELECO|nr:hypothetical protein PR202_ga27926 [Eleusine coracana subsp. coracana]